MIKGTQYIHNILLPIHKDIIISIEDFTKIKTIKTHSFDTHHLYSLPNTHAVQ